jgi:glutamyl-tRNA synthetase
MSVLENVADPGNGRRVRTRFAPSPTGFLHLGTMRTALFSWLLARRFGGDFLLRIEDTDQERLVPGGLENIVESLRLMGMDYDEGPDRASVAALDSAKYGTVRPELLLEDGGKYGPYFQSQRLERYQSLVAQLVEDGKAYYAFETKEELEGMRAAAQLLKKPFLYDRRYREYPLAEAKARVANGEPHVVRFKMPLMGPIVTQDALRGEIIFDAATQDDFVILKADGYPPYHLAAIVDDHDMEISHVLRGEDWLPSFPKHIALSNALGWEAPVYVHTPNVLAPGGGKKLSKRFGAQSVAEYLAEGYLQESLVNFLALLGWSPGDDKEIMPVEELIARFDLSNVSLSPATFDKEKCLWMNGVYIRHLDTADLVKRTLPFLQGAGYLPAEPSADELTYAAEVIGLEQERMKRLDEAPGFTDFFFCELPEYDEKSAEKWLKKNSESVIAYLSDVASVLTDAPDWNVGSVEALVREVGAKHGRDKGDITHPMRVAVSGREVGPGLFEMIAVLGRERVLARLRRAVEIARG